jgi:23S rRNA (cytosine1962-C5)-methyltransferase
MVASRDTLEEDLARALVRRSALLARLHVEGTDCYRLFHGAAEGRPGLAVDRYGPVLLVQTWRAPLGAGDLDRIAGAVATGTGLDLAPAWRHRGAADEPETRPADVSTAAPMPVSPRTTVGDRPCDTAPARREDIPGAASPYQAPALAAPDPRLSEPVACELGVWYDVRPLHRGQDPLLFLDLRAGRRQLKGAAAGRSVLNLYAYTCTAGVLARTAGATEVWNVDFAESALAVGRANAARNGADDPRFVTIREDAIVVARQLAGLPIKGRGARRRTYRRFEARAFDIVVLDPPRWAAGPFGAVDVVRDYPSLFKPALLATGPGGHILATNHVPAVGLSEWLAVLARTAEKAGRKLAGIDVLPPEEDFPSFDGHPPLKMAWVTVAA